MQHMPGFPSVPGRAWLFLALPLTALIFGAATSIDAARGPAVAQSGSANPSFQRHFWRGQNNHGNIDFEARRATPSTGAATAEALVEEGTPAAAIARSASVCASRFKSYDPVTGTYVDRGGRTRACR